MGRKRKNVTFSAEGTTSNASPEMNNARVLRRSNRLNSPTPTYPAQVRNPIAEHFNLDENDDEEDQFPKKDTTTAQVTEPVFEHSNLDKNDHVSADDTTLGKSAEEKENPEKQPQVEEVINIRAASETNVEPETEYFVQSDDEFKFNNDSPVATRSSGGPSQDLSYRSLYIRAQKKIEVLMEEKFMLLQELQFSRGQITAFEKMKDMFTSREVIVVPGLPNATTSALSAQARLQNHVGQSSAADEDLNASPKAKQQTYKRKSRRN